MPVSKNVLNESKIVSRVTVCILLCGGVCTHILTHFTRIDLTDEGPWMTVLVLEMENWTNLPEILSPDFSSCFNYLVAVNCWTEFGCFCFV